MVNMWRTQKIHQPGSAIWGCPNPGTHLPPIFQRIYLQPTVTSIRYLNVSVTTQHRFVGNLGKTLRSFRGPPCTYMFIRIKRPWKITLRELDSVQMVWKPHKLDGEIKIGREDEFESILKMVWNHLWKKSLEDNFRSKNDHKIGLHSFVESVRFQGWSKKLGLW